MAWRIDFTRNADKAMRKLDKGVAARVFDELDEIAKLEDPRSKVRAARNENARPALSQAGGSFV